MILANDEVEVFNNTFRDNDTTHILLVSFRTAAVVGGFVSTDPTYDQFDETIYILDNIYIGGGENPARTVADLIGSIVGMPFPDILYDGDEDRRKLVDGQLPDELRLCIQETDATFYDIDIPTLGALANPDLSRFDCTHPRLQPVVIPPAS
jgi:hypothetical protein